jgi:type IV pilus assembly protein PilM
MATKVISIELGFSITKVCELDYQTENPKVYHSFVLDTPQGVLAEDGTVMISEEFVNNFKEKLANSGMKSRQVVFSISSSKIASREVKLPFVKENRLAMLVRSSAPDFFPIDLSTYELAHIILGTEGEEDKKQYRLMILAAPNSLLDSYRILGKAIGLEVLAIDYVANSVYNVASRNTVEGTDMVVKVDERSALVLILEGGSIVLSRTVPYGIDQAIDTIMNNEVFGEKLSYLEAIEVSRRKACIHKSADEHSNDTTGFEGVSAEQISIARKDVTNSLSSLIGGIARVLDYWNSRNSASTVQKIYLTGLGGDFSGLSKLMTSEIGTKVKVLTEVKGITLSKDYKEVSFGEYLACIGASINPVDFTDGREKKKERGKTNYKVVGIAVMVAGLLVAAALAAISVIPYTAQNTLNKTLNNQIADMQPAYNTYAEYVQAEADYLKMTSLDATAESRLDDLTAFIGEMEEKMPTTLRVSTFTATTEGITMDVTVERKEEVAKAIEQFKTFESLYYADTTAVTTAQDEASGEKNTFTVTLQYKPLITETVEE